MAGVLAQPWLLIVGTLALGAGQGPATATMDGLLSVQAGADEQGWIAGVMQSLQTGINVVAPVLAGVLYATLAHSMPYWLGFAMAVAAVVLIGRLPFASPSRVKPDEQLPDGLVPDAAQG